MFSFPTFRAWQSAFLLMIPSYGAATLVFLFGFWLFFFTFCILLPQYDPAFLFFLGTALICLIVGSLWYLLVIFLYTQFLRLLWNKPPKFLNPPQSLKQNLIHLQIAIASTFPIALIYVVYLYFTESIEKLIYIKYDSTFTANFILKLSWLWLIIAAYIYQWKYLIENKK